MNRSSKTGLFYVGLLFVIVSIIFTWRLIAILIINTESRLGDGQHVESYGFDLSRASIPLDEIIASGLAKDGLKSLDNPPMMQSSEVLTLNEEIRGKYLVSHDLVVGLAIQGDARAYPIRVLQWHEIVNDTVGGVPVAVTYNPMCDSVVVFRRELNGETLSFGFSGLLHTSNSLLYDRRDDPAQESLWSQLLCRAVSGKASASETLLETLPCAIYRWDKWLERYPDSKVIQPERGLLRPKYMRDPYGSYHSSNKIRFPVSPAIPPDGASPKTKLLVLFSENTPYAFSYPYIKQNIGPDGEWTTQLGNREFVFEITEEPDAARVAPANGNSADSLDYSVIYSYYFAWYAMFPDVSIDIAML